MQNALMLLRTQFEKLAKKSAAAHFARHDVESRLASTIGKNIRTPVGLRLKSEKVKLNSKTSARWRLIG